MKRLHNFLYFSHSPLLYKFKSTLIIIMNLFNINSVYSVFQMLTQYGLDIDVTIMLDKMDWIVLPVLNVDGYSYTWNGGSARMWRKTRSRGSRCYGADPNRNWDYKWGGACVSHVTL